MAQHSLLPAGRWARLGEGAFASLVFALGLLLAAPFVALLLIPVYVTYFFHGL